MDKITSDVRHKQWLDIIHACNASGLTRKAWCEQNGINIKTFYYWQRQLRREAHDAHICCPKNDTGTMVGTGNNYNSIPSSTA